MSSYTHPFAPVADDTPDLARIEAKVRLRMRMHADIKPRGFDSIRERDGLHREIDALLDQHALIASFVTDEL